MERLKTTTILITSLAMATPAPSFAEGSNAALKACVAAHMQSGESRAEARAACSGAAGGGATRKSAEPRAVPQPVQPIPGATLKAQEQATQQRRQQQKAAQEQAARDQAAQEQAAKDRAAQKRAAQQQAARDKAAKDQAARDKAASDKAALGQAMQGKGPKLPGAVPAQPAEPAQPALTGQPAQPAVPAVPAQPAQPAVPAEPAQPAAGPKLPGTKLPGAKTPPEQPTAPVGTETVSPAQPAVPLLPTNGKIPANGNIPTKGNIPANGNIPTNGNSPAIGDVPATELPATATAERPKSGSPVIDSLTAAPAEKQGKPVTNEALTAVPPGAIPNPGAIPMQEEVITRDNSRRSSQDFSTTLDGRLRPGSGSGPVQVMPGLPGMPGLPAPVATSKKKKDKGLSDVEKLAIAGIAALAVGALLSNGSRVASNTGDRVVVQYPDGSYRVIKDDNAILRQPGSTIRTQDYADGSSRTVVTKSDGSQIITVYDPQRRIVQRVLVEPDGRRYVLIDDSRGAPPVRMSSSGDSGYGYVPRVSSGTDDDALRAALAAEGVEGRRYTLSQIRDIYGVRMLAPVIGTENITFASGSSAISPEQAHALAGLGATLRDEITADPRQIFLIEGHTDAVGDPAMNLTLSDRRAESLALALSEYFDVPAENLVVQGYGEEDLAVQTSGASEANRRVVVRRITDLLQVAQE